MPPVEPEPLFENHVPSSAPGAGGPPGDYERWFRVLDAQMRVLERERQKLAAIMNHADAAFVLMDPDRRVIWSNASVERLFGVADRPELAGRLCHQVVCGADAMCEGCPAIRPFASGSVAHGEIQLRSGGSTRHIYATAMPLASPEGRVEQVLLMLQDISDLTILRTSQEALQASEKRFRSIFTHAAAGMAMVSDDGRLLEANDALAMLLDYEPAEVRRLGLSDILHAEDHEKVLSAIAEARDHPDRTTDLEARCVSRHGSIVWTRTGASWIPTLEGQPPCAVLLLQDISRRKQLEQDLRQAEKMSAVGLLVSGVAHELNNPLAGVLGYAQLLVAEDSSPRIRRGLEAIHREAERCKRIVQNLQTFARKHKPQEDAIHMNELLRGTLELRAYHLRVDDVKVVLELDPGLPMTRGDSHQLQQVLLNLIVNAHQAIVSLRRGGTLTLRTARRGARLVIEVQDDGPGVPAEHLGRVFDPFFTTKEVGQGTGLGLSICYGIVEEHSGTIRVRNAAGGGAVFTVELPLRDPLGATGRPEETIAAGAASADAVPCPAAAARILVVDDEPSILEVLERMLRLDGHQVVTAATGGDAMRLIDAGRFDAIVSDLRMPGVSGQELFMHLRASHPDQAEVVIFSTGDMLNESTREFLGQAGRPCLAKPFALEELRSAIAAVLEAQP
jgi:two-component system NtrC family sensor kinase